MTFSGALSTTTSGISVLNSNSGTIAFSGATKTLNTGASAAVTLTGNTGATINFTGGGLDIDTTSAVAFNATGGGTISVTGSGNSINNTGAVATHTNTALNVENTTIGAGGLNFVSITSGGGANGIVLNNTGASGGLTVSGDGGGANNGSGGTIQNSTASGILLTTTRSVSLNYMTIQTANEDGIEGTGVVGLTMNRTNVTNNGDDSEDVGIGIDNLTGTVAWTNLSVTQSELANVFIHIYIL